MTAYAGEARGLYAVTSGYSAEGRGKHAACGPYSGQGRGLHAVTAAFSAEGRGRHAVCIPFSAEGRGKHAVCIACSGQGRGLHRVANDVLAGYELHRGVDASPDLAAAPWESFSALPHETAALDVSHEYRFVARRRNAWNLASQNLDEWVLELDADGNQVLARPSAPADVELDVLPGLTVRLRAAYGYAADGSRQAGQFLVYLTSDGGDPDPGVDEPTVIDMVKSDGVARLDWTSPAPFLEDAVVKVLIRARRVVTEADPEAEPPVEEVHVDSDNVDVHQVTVSLPDLAAPAPASVWFAKAAEQGQ